MYDVLVKNGRIVTADSVSEGNIAIRDGKIAAVLNAGEEPEAAKVIDAKGNYVFPGAIDTHAHLNDPGYEWREDYEHGTAAAALGGYTTVIDMPLQNEPQWLMQKHLILTEKKLIRMHTVITVSGAD